MPDRVHALIADERKTNIDFDLPLQPETALERDRLFRNKFAESAAASLLKVSSTGGLVLSIEGVWGSGKSSTLAMIQALLSHQDSSKSPVIVHFNPWLIGEKEALLRQFLSTIAQAIDESDLSKKAKNVASELRAYAKVFDLVKLIPGAEPWASMVKSLVAAAGDATEAIAAHKTPSLEAYKHNVERALVEFDRPVIIFIDDIDRLYPAEVFEMIRIIKAVGALPRVAYVLAWDSSYVSEALENLGVPQAGGYLDKIVQMRMPLPNLSFAARETMLEAALAKLDAEALRPRFPNQDRRLGFLFHSGLRDLLAQPRDIARVFNALCMVEPLVRGEIVFADILALSALSVKASPVHELLKSRPQLFVGRLPSELFDTSEKKQVLRDGGEERLRAYKACDDSRAAQKVVHFLFPEVAGAENRYSLGSGSYVEGVISHPARLVIALQLSLTDGDVSIKAAREYLQNPEARAQIASRLSAENCVEFVDMVAEVATFLQGEGVQGLTDICVSIARLVDEPLFVQRSKSSSTLLSPKIEDLALSKIRAIAYTQGAETFKSVTQAIAVDGLALSCAAEILDRNYLTGRNTYSDEDRIDTDRSDAVQAAFTANVMAAAEEGRLFDQNRVSGVLRTLARLMPEQCPALLATLRYSDPTLDEFAIHYFVTGWSSNSGSSYSAHAEDVLNNAYCPMGEMRKHAETRLGDPSLAYPARAAWRAITEGSPLYGDDGTPAIR